MGPLISGLALGAANFLGQTATSNLKNKNQLRLNEHLASFNKHLNDLQTAEYWRNYNSPSAQKMSYEQAGINPFAETAIQANEQAPQPNSVDGFEFSVPQINEILTPLFDIAMQIKQFDMLDSQIRNVEASTDKTKSDTDVTKFNLEKMLPQQFLKSVQDYQTGQISMQTLQENFNQLLKDNKFKNDVDYPHQQKRFTHEENMYQSEENMTKYRENVLKFESDKSANNDKAFRLLDKQLSKIIDTSFGQGNSQLKSLIQIFSSLLLRKIF